MPLSWVSFFWLCVSPGILTSAPIKDFRTCSMTFCGFSSYSTKAISWIYLYIHVKQRPYISQIAFSLCHCLVSFGSLFDTTHAMLWWCFAPLRKNRSRRYLRHRHGGLPESARNRQLGAMILSSEGPVRRWSQRSLSCYPNKWLQQHIVHSRLRPSFADFLWVLVLWLFQVWDQSLLIQSQGFDSVCGFQR